MLPCPALGFAGSCLQAEVFHRVVELLIARMGSWGARRGWPTPAWASRREAVMPPQPIPVPRMGTPSWLWLSQRSVSFSHLATSVPWGPAEGEQAYEMEWLWEHLQPLEEGLADPTSLCRLALAICLASSWYSSLTHPSCCLWGSTLGTMTQSPCKLVLPPSGCLHQRTRKGSTWWDVQGPNQPSPVLILRSKFNALSSI